jgi:hypothetical protein
MNVKKIKIHNFEPILAYGHDPAYKSQNLNLGMMINNHILLFQLPGNWPTTEKCAPYFRGNTEFPIYFNIWGLGAARCTQNFEKS